MFLILQYLSYFFKFTFVPREITHQNDCISPSDILLKKSKLTVVCVLQHFISACNFSLKFLSVNILSWPQQVLIIVS